METILERGYTVPLSGETDSDAINCAIQTAVDAGLNKTVIPRYNRAKHAFGWTLDAPVFVPSDFTLVFDNAELTFQGAGAICAAGTEENPLKNVCLLGIGNAMLKDGGAESALLQAEHVKNLRVSSLAISNPQTRGISCHAITESRIFDITFLNDSIDWQKDCMRRGNGIFIGAGSNNVTVEHILGRTYGNTLEISAVCDSGAAVTRGITVRNVASDCFGFANIRLINAGESLLSNILIDGVTDLSQEGAPYRARTAVSVGDAVFGKIPAALGETRNITIKNVVTRGFSAVNLVNAVQDITIADVTVKADGGAALSCDRTLQYHNIYLCNVKFDDRTTGAYPIDLVRVPAYIGAPAEQNAHFYPYRAVCNMRDIHGDNFKINGVYGNMVDNLLRITGKNSLEIYDVDIENIVYDDVVGDDITINE